MLTREVAADPKTIFYDVLANTLPISAPLWALDEVGVGVACAHLNVRWPVEITQAEPEWWNPALGSYHARSHDRRHIITIVPGIPADLASACIWHELTHALQCERHGGSPLDWHAAIKDSYNPVRRAGGDAYLTHPIEAEAFANMVLHFDVGTTTRALAPQRPLDNPARGLYPDFLYGRKAHTVIYDWGGYA